jgi:5'-phosphate synthase pdxT subunit
MKVGVLALQGAFIEHIKMLEDLGVETAEVRLPADLEGLDGLIIPGGESTTIGKLATAYDLIKPLQAFGKKHPIWGTCAGAIFLSKDAQREQPLLGLMDITVQRNAFGSQVESFEVGLDVPALALVENDNDLFDAVFIRAPLIESVDAEDVKILASLDDGTIVAAQQNNLLATSFHPELNDDDRFHRYFLDMLDH